MPGREEGSAPGCWHVPLPGVALGGHGGERVVPRSTPHVGKVPALSPNLPSVLISSAEDGDAVTLKGRSTVSPLAGEVGRRDEDGLALPFQRAASLNSFGGAAPSSPLGQLLVCMYSETPACLALLSTTLKLVFNLKVRAWLNRDRGHESDGEDMKKPLTFWMVSIAWKCLCNCHARN